MEGSIAFVDTAAPGGDEGNELLNLTPDEIFRRLAKKLYKLMIMEMLIPADLVKPTFTEDHIYNALKTIYNDGENVRYFTLGVYRTLLEKYNRLYPETPYYLFFTLFLIIRVLFLCNYDKEEIMKAFSLFENRKYFEKTYDLIERRMKLGINGALEVTESEKEVIDSNFSANSDSDTEEEQMSDEDEGADYNPYKDMARVLQLTLEQKYEEAYEQYFPDFRNDIELTLKKIGLQNPDISNYLKTLYYLGSQYYTDDLINFLLARVLTELGYEQKEVGEILKNRKAEIVATVIGLKKLNDVDNPLQLISEYESSLLDYIRQFGASGVE